MAVGVLFDVPGGTKEAYEEINQRAFGNPKGPSEPISGLIIHTAGPTGSGWRIFDVWESADEFQRFMDETIMPATAEMPDLPEIQPEVYELTNVLAGSVPAPTT